MQDSSEVRILKAKIKQEEANIEIANASINTLSKALLEIEYPFMGWGELKLWLIENRPENNYEKNPIVSRSDGYTKTYCFINTNNELQIGPYRYADFFKRGEKLRVHYQFKSWR